MRLASGDVVILGGAARRAYHGVDRILPGMAQEDVRQLLGRPSEVQGLARARGVVWSYRYENQFCDWFQVELLLQQQVRSAGYGKPPECEQRDGIFPF